MSHDEVGHAIHDEVHDGEVHDYCVNNIYKNVIITTITPLIISLSYAYLSHISEM